MLLHKGPACPPPAISDLVCACAPISASTAPQAALSPASTPLPCGMRCLGVCGTTPWPTFNHLSEPCRDTTLQAAPHHFICHALQLQSPHPHGWGVDENSTACLCKRLTPNCLVVALCQLQSLAICWEMTLAPPHFTQRPAPTTSLELVCRFNACAVPWGDRLCSTATPQVRPSTKCPSCDGLLKKGPPADFLA